MAYRPALVPGTMTATATFDRSGRDLTVYLSGELDASSTPTVGAAIDEHLHEGDVRLSLDLSSLTFCDSSGLALLFRLNQRANDTSTFFAIYAPTPFVRRIITMCDPSGVLSIRS